MGMVFQNLISNAIKYTTNQNIIITLEERNNSVYFQIKMGLMQNKLKMSIKFGNLLCLRLFAK